MFTRVGANGNTCHLHQLEGDMHDTLPYFYSMYTGGTLISFWRQYLPVVRGQGAKVDVGAGHATFTGLRTVQIHFKIPQKQKINNHHYH